LDAFVLKFGAQNEEYAVTRLALNCTTADGCVLLDYGDGLNESPPTQFLRCSGLQLTARDKHFLD
jgi:hypothetical protein